MPKVPASPPRDVVTRLQAGVERLLDQGQTYAEIQINALVKEAGVAKSTFYVHFEDKNELLRALAAGVMQDLADFDRAWWTLPPDASKDQTYEALTLMYEAYAAHGALMAAIVDATLYDRDMRQQFEALMAGVIDDAAAHLRHGQRAGTVPAHLDSKRTAFWLMWMLERGFNRLLLGRAGPARTRSLQAMADIIWRTARDGTA